MSIPNPLIVLRQVKGSELTYSEADSNFANLRDSVMAVSGQVDSNLSLANSNHATVSARVTETENDIVVLESEVSGHTLTINDHETRIDALEIEVVTNFNELEADIIALNGRVDNAEDSLVDHETRIDTLEFKVVSPFNYRGSVAGGTQVSPFDLETLTNKANGDYYKVSSSGYFVDSLLVVHFLNASDSFVFVSGTIEKFDNTDTTVSGGSAYVSVTGNTDDGYSVDLSQTTKDSIDSISSLSSTVSGHTTQIGDLETDVADHETRISTLESTSTTLLYATKASGRAPFTTTDPDQIVDSFDSTVLKTAKYVAQAELADGSMHASEILITNNGTTVYITEYAKLNGGTDLVTYSADFNGTLIELYATPVNANTTITFARTSIKKA